MIVPVMTIVGDTDTDAERELVRASLSAYGSTPNYAFIWDEAGFEGTTVRIREKQKAGEFAGMAAQITDAHIEVFATESNWDDLATAPLGEVRRNRLPPGVLQRPDGPGKTSPRWPDSAPPAVVMYPTCRV